MNGCFVVYHCEMKLVGNEVCHFLFTYNYQNQFMHNWLHWIHHIARTTMITCISDDVETLEAI